MKHMEVCLVVGIEHDARKKNESCFDTLTVRCSLALAQKPKHQDPHNCSRRR